MCMQKMNEYINGIHVYIIYWCVYIYIYILTYIYIDIGISYGYMKMAANLWIQDDPGLIQDSPVGWFMLLPSKQRDHQLGHFMKFPGWWF